MNIDFNCGCKAHIMRIIVEDGIYLTCFTANRSFKDLPFTKITKNEYNIIIDMLKKFTDTSDDNDIYNTNMLESGYIIKTAIFRDINIMNIFVFKNMKKAIKMKFEFDIAIDIEEAKRILNQVDHSV